MKSNTEKEQTTATIEREEIAENNTESMNDEVVMEGGEVNETQGTDERGELQKQCHDIATSENILEKFVVDCKKSGLVGEEKLSKLLYLAFTTRIFDRPVSIAVKGESSGGKSFLVDSVLDFFPSSAYLQFSSMSDKALIYSEASFVNKFLYFAEADGISEKMEYFLRTLLSENHIRHEVTVEKESGGFKTQVITKEGPTGLILTTTRPKLHAENETRIISVNVVDTKDQLQAVLMKMSEDEDEEFDYKPWLAFQEWIESGPTKAVIPYAKRIAQLINVDAPRMRRDYKALLNLIRAHAILHQKNRDRDQKGRVIAVEDDYRTAYDLVSLFIAEGVEQSVSDRIRQTVQAVMELLESKQENSGEIPGLGFDGHSIPLTKLAHKLELNKGTVSRRVDDAERFGYLTKAERRPGRPLHIKLGEPLPEEQEVLPSPEKLFDDSEK